MADTLICELITHAKPAAQRRAHCAAMHCHMLLENDLRTRSLRRWLSRRALGARFHRLASALAGQPLFWLAFIITMFTWPIVRSIHAERRLPHGPPVLGLVHDFTLRDPNGDELGRAELRGRIWVASFTTIDGAPTLDPPRQAMMRMADVRHRTRNLGDAIRLVTFVVDSHGDAAEHMLALSAIYRASHGNWRFVSGPPAPMNDVLRDLHVADGVPLNRCALVDGQMRIRGYYDLGDAPALDALLRDVSLLISVGG
jgi:protein SCO1